EAAPYDGDADVGRRVAAAASVRFPLSVGPAAFAVRHRTTEYGTIAYHMQAPSRDRANRRRHSPPALLLSTPEKDHRSRLVQGMAIALTEKGYADISVADIVQHARVSKRTFYEHFADKEACYLA